MIGTAKGQLAPKYKAGPWAFLPVLTVASLALFSSQAFGAPAANDPAATQTRQLLDSANKALKEGNLNLALIQLKNAVRLAPTDGEARAQLGIALLRGGDLAAAERELRQAQNDYGPYELIVPALLHAMLQRNEIKELLTQFPDPQQGTSDKTTADILIARASALQVSGQPKEARAAMDRSLAMRRDADGLVASVRLAEMQDDFALANSQTDEALKLSPTNEMALTASVLLARRSADMKKALASADEYVRRVPKSALAKVLRIEVLLELKDDTRAKQEVDVLLKEQPKSPYGQYYHAVLTARGKDLNGAWREMQGLPPEFVQSQQAIAAMVAGIAVGSGNAESGGAILTTFIARHPDDRLGRLQLAAIRLSQNAAQAAVDALTPIKAANDPAVHALLAQAYLRLQRYDEAIASLEIASATPKANDLLKRQLALSQLQVGDRDQGIQGLRSLTERDPGNPAVAAPLIAALVNAAKWDEALGVADAMAKKTPTSALPAFYRGQILVARGKLPEGLAAFSQSLALDPKFVPALYYRANASMARGNAEDAKKDLQTIIAQNPTNTLAYIRLSQIALDAGQTPEALATLDRAIKAAPKDAAPRLALANYQIAQRKYPEAQATVSGILQVSKDNPEATALQGQIQSLQGQPAEALKTFRALASANPTSSGAYALLARASYVMKDQSGAEEAAKKAVELAPGSVQVRSNLIDIQIAGGKPENGVTTARAFATSYPGTEADLLLSDTLVRLKRANEAEVILNKSLGTKPDSRIVQRLRQIALGSGDSKKANAVVSGWIAKNPNDFAMRREYASLIMEEGDLAGARKEYEALLKLHPDDPVVLNNMGFLLQKDDPDRALTLVSQAAKIAPQSSEISDSLGWLKYQRQDRQGALPLLQRAHDMNANSPVISYHLALVLDANGKRPEAKTLLQATLAKTPKFEGSDEAKQTLARW